MKCGCSVTSASRTGRASRSRTRLRQLAEASVAVGSEVSLEDVLQKTVETAAGVVAASYGALGILDRTGSHLERLITTGIDEETRAEIGDLPMDHGVLRCSRSAIPDTAEIMTLPHGCRPCRPAGEQELAPGEPVLRSLAGLGYRHSGVASRLAASRRT
jgi:hypothetical protein